MGLIPYLGFCGHEAIAAQLNNILDNFGPQFCEVKFHTTDCGKDVQNFVEVIDDKNIYNFRCLAHIVTLIVKKYVLAIEATEEDDDDEHITYSTSISTVSQETILDLFHFDLLRIEDV